MTLLESILVEFDEKLDHNTFGEIGSRARVKSFLSSALQKLGGGVLGSVREPYGESSHCSFCNDDGTCHGILTGCACRSAIKNYLTEQGIKIEGV